MHTFGFDCQYQEKKTRARVGVIHTPHGDIETPCFVPVGTQATVKSLTPDELHDLDVKLFFVNTYHTYLRPGLDVIQKFGGLHKFMGWDGPIITDSGGFQVFSLGREKYGSSFVIPAKAGIQLDEGIPAHSSRVRDDKIGDREAAPTLVKITDDGVEFRSHWDGTKHLFTPESSMQYQWTLGSDIHIAFDDCTPNRVTHTQAEKSMERTHRWAVRSLQANAKCQMIHATLKKSYQALYGSIQGSIFQDLREKSAKFITSLPFDGYAVGGVSVGESKEDMRHVMDWVMPYLPPDKPRHLLGVGEIDDIFALVEHGFDTFDCVQPTRIARMGRVYSRQLSAVSHQISDRFEIDILKKAYERDMDPIEKGCKCFTCQHFSRAYIHHLFRVRELLGYRLATIHNIYFIHQLVGELRLAIRSDSFVALKKQWNID